MSAIVLWHCDANGPLSHETCEPVEWSSFGQHDRWDDGHGNHPLVSIHFLGTCRNVPPESRLTYLAIVDQDASNMSAKRSTMILWTYLEGRCLATNNFSHDNLRVIIFEDSQ
jgi:hypothetical protein